MLRPNSLKRALIPNNRKMLLMDRKAPHLQERGGGFAELIGDQEVTISFIALHLAQ